MTPHADPVISKTAWKVIPKWIVAFLCLPCITWGQVAHPRIWLDSATLTRLDALKSANDPTYLAMKSDADTYLTYTVPPYRVCGSNEICYDYEGQGWWLAIEPLALAYQMTKDTTYSDQVKAILNVMIAAGVAPVNVDSGYPSRFIVLALAIAYDWCYDQLSSTDKNNLTSLLDTYWAAIQANGYQWAPAYRNGYGNYFGGHLLGFGLASIAVEGDDSNAATMQSICLGYFNSLVVPAFTSGGFEGGFPVEGWNYGNNNFIRLFQYMLGMKTSGKLDLFTEYSSFIKAVATNTIYSVRPDLWAVNDEGDWPGNVTRVFYPNFAVIMAGLLNGTNEGGWMQSLYTRLATPPDGVVGTAPTNTETFLYNMGQAAVDYTATQPTYRFSPGDQRTTIRTDWTTSAVHTTFNGGAMRWVNADHQVHDSGHLAIQRGMDYLLINAEFWKGTDGVTGTPQGETATNANANTLFYWDNGADCLSQTSSSGQYYGCQMFWTDLNTVKHNEAANWAFQEAPIRGAYTLTGSVSTINAYVRSWIIINDISIVFDRISVASGSYTRQLRWHTPALNTAMVPGNATALTLSGGIGSVTVGASTLWIKPLLPASLTFTRVTDEAYNGSGQNVGSQFFQMEDSNASTCTVNCLFLTVLAPTASSVTFMPPTRLLAPTGFYGALYDDGVIPRVALFSADGTSLAGVTYTASYSSSLMGRHVVLDLMPGTYNVIKDGTIIYSGLTVKNDGSLSFMSTGGSTFTIQMSGASQMVLPPTDLRATLQ